MKTIFIYFISGIIIVITSFLTYKLISLFIQKERKIAEELIKKDNGKELINERTKRIIIMAICFYFGFSIISFIVILIILLIKKYTS
jgi:ABC-type Fe3+-citrate transport system substrate-binding protein